MGVVFFLIWVVCGVFAASIASSKGYSGCLWLIVGFLLGPLALLGIGFMEKRSPEEANSYDYAPCPYCVEPIRKGAVKCRHCGSAVNWE